LQKIRAAFTLFELIIVIVIIGAVYLLFFAGINTPKKEVKDFAALKDMILQRTDGKSAKIQCAGDKCEKCTVYSKGAENALESTRELDFTLFDSKPKIFEYDKFGYLDEKKYADDICFEYKIYENMSSSNMLVERDGKYYIFYSLLQQAEVFSDYGTATQRFNPANTLPVATNQYYYERR